MATPLKDQYDRPYLEGLAAVVAAHAPAAFDAGAFVDAVLADGWQALELKGRMRRISETLREFLPDDYLAALSIVRSAAGEFDGYLAMYFPDFVGRHGLDHWDASVDALHWMTRFGSSEFAVRPFLMADAPRMLATLLAWTRDPNEHVRRLASEGCRPRLPWALNLPAFQQDPAPLLPILSALRDDPSEYVRRSVANNLNDIAKDHPGFVLDVARAWRGHSATCDKLVKHACRTLLKSGDAGALRLFGFRDPADIEVAEFRLSPGVVPLGGELTFRFSLRSPAGLGKVRLEYLVEFARPHGRGARKVFHISESDSAAETRDVVRRHCFVDRSTRRHYPGEHRLTLRVNGVAKAAATFRLEA